MNDPDDQPCPHGDYRSCVVDECRPFRRVHVAGVIVPPAPQIVCMWCGANSERGQCGPCAALLEAIRAAPRNGIVAIIDATRAEWEMPQRVVTESSSACAAKLSVAELPIVQELPSIAKLNQLCAAMTPRRVKESK